MIVETKISLTSPILGDSRPDKAGVRRLRKTSDGRIKINETQWRESLTEAAKQLKIKDFDPKTISFESGFDPQAMTLIRRVYNRTNIEFFEGVDKDQKLTFEYMVEEVPGAPTLEQLKQMWNVIGKYIGMSQFGNKFQLGRFTVMYVRECSLGNN